MTDFINDESDDQLRERIAAARRAAESRFNRNNQKYEGPIFLEEGSLVHGVECRGTFKLFNMETGELHREGKWEGVYCGSEVELRSGMMYHHFLEASVDGNFCGFFGQPAYRFMGVTEAGQ